MKYFFKLITAVKQNWLIIPILALGLSLRLWGLGFGLPQLTHYDEQRYIYSALYMAGNLLKPPLFLTPMFYPLLLAGVFGLNFFYGWVIGRWDNPFTWLVEYLADPSAVVIMGRATTVITALVTVLALYITGKKLYGLRAGTLSALFLSVAFVHVQESHYIKEDVLVGLIFLLSFYVSHKIVTCGSRRIYVVAGVLLGIAAATKYNFFLLLPMYFMAHMFAVRNTHQRLRLKSFFNNNWWRLIGFTVVTYFLFNPYVLINYREASADIIRQGRLATHAWVVTATPVWQYTLFTHLKVGVGLGLEILGAVGLFYLGLYRRRRIDLLLVVTPVSFVATLFLFGGQNFARYLLSILLFLLLAAGVAVDKISSWVRPQLRLIVLAGLIVATLYEPIIRSLRFDYLLTRPDTRHLSQAWIEVEIPVGVKIANEGAFRDIHLSVQGPALIPDGNKLTTYKIAAEKNKINSIYLNGLVEAYKSKKGYYLTGVPRLDYRYDVSLNQFVPIPDVTPYVDGHVCYLIASSWTKHNGERYPELFNKSLVEHYKLVKVFTPNPVLSEDPIWLVDSVALDSVDLFDNNLIYGPVIKVYKLKGDSAFCR